MKNRLFKVSLSENHKDQRNPKNLSFRKKSREHEALQRSAASQCFWGHRHQPVGPNSLSSMVPRCFKGSGFLWELGHGCIFSFSLSAAGSWGPPLGHLCASLREIISRVSSERFWQKKKTKAHPQKDSTCAASTLVAQGRRFFKSWGPSYTPTNCDRTSLTLSILSRLLNKLADGWTTKTHPARSHCSPLVCNSPTSNPRDLGKMFEEILNQLCKDPQHPGQKQSFTW